MQLKYFLIFISTIFICCYAFPYNTLSSTTAATLSSSIVGRSCNDSCSNEPPTFTCEQQYGWGKCSAVWMKGFCCKTCANISECNAENVDTDIAPPRGFETCEAIAAEGNGSKCFEPWMEGYCCKSCANASLCAIGDFVFFAALTFFLITAVGTTIVILVKKHISFFVQESKIMRFGDLVVQQCKLTLGQLNIIRSIDYGSTACVRLARYFPHTSSEEFIEVAVKSLNHNNFIEAMKEVEIMKKCDHKNVVKFVGWLKEDDIIHIVSEFMHGGNLHTYLRNGENKVTVGQCFSFITQILDGMIYLSHKHIVHRDLAARNCLLNSTHELLKISDFGLSRESDVNYEYISNNNDTKLPFRWIPFEAFHTKLFSTRGDIWAFGVVVWEIFMRGTLPYKHLRDLQSVSNYLLSGNRLPKPDYCTPQLYEIMFRCWNKQPKARPSFDEIKISVIEIINFCEKETEMMSNNEYERFYTNIILLDESE